MNPRTLCACHPVAFMISARVAPLARPIMSRIFAPLLSARGTLAFFAAVGLAAFVRALAFFLGAAGLALPPLAVFWPLGASCLRVASFFEEAFSGATCAPCSATAAALSAAVVSGLVMLFLVILFCACFAHDDSSLRLSENAREL